MEPGNSGRENKFLMEDTFVDDKATPAETEVEAALQAGQQLDDGISQPD